MGQNDAFAPFYPGDEPDSREPSLVRFDDAYLSSSVPLERQSHELVSAGIRFWPGKKEHRISQSGMSVHEECLCCFDEQYIDGAKTPRFGHYLIHIAHDIRLKIIGDHHREAQMQSAVMEQTGLNLLPFAHPQLEEWRDARFAGLKMPVEDAPFLLQGAIDDLWVDIDTGLIYIIDYKSTYHRSYTPDLHGPFGRYYTRQIEFYQYLLRGMGFPVSDTGFVVYANADPRANIEVDVLSSADDPHYHMPSQELVLRSFVGDTSWIPDSVNDVVERLDIESAKNADTHDHERLPSEIEGAASIFRSVKRRALRQLQDRSLPHLIRIKLYPEIDESIYHALSELGEGLGRAEIVNALLERVMDDLETLIESYLANPSMLKALRTDAFHKREQHSEGCEVGKVLFRHRFASTRRAVLGQLQSRAVPHDLYHEIEKNHLNNIIINTDRRNYDINRDLKSQREIIQGVSLRVDALVQLLPLSWWLQSCLSVESVDDEKLKDFDDDTKSFLVSLPKYIKDSLSQRALELCFRAVHDLEEVTHAASVQDVRLELMTYVRHAALQERLKKSLCSQIEKVLPSSHVRTLARSLMRQYVDRHYHTLCQSRADVPSLKTAKEHLQPVLEQVLTAAAAAESCLDVFDADGLDEKGSRGRYEKERAQKARKTFEAELLDHLDELEGHLEGVRLHHLESVIKRYLIRILERQPFPKPVLDHMITRASLLAKRIDLVFQKHEVHYSAENIHSEVDKRLAALLSFSTAYFYARESIEGASVEHPQLKPALLPRLEAVVRQAYSECAKTDAGYPAPYALRDVVQKKIDLMSADLLQSER